jgi:hypothetical protein
MQFVVRLPFCFANEKKEAVRFFAFAGNAGLIVSKAKT